MALMWDPDEIAGLTIEALLANNKKGLDLPDEIGVADLERDAIDFNVELRLLEAHDLRAPVWHLDDGPVLPVSLAAIVPTPWDDLTEPGLSHREGTEEFDRWAEKALISIRAGRTVPGGKLVPREEARGAFFERAKSFLSSRIRGTQRLRDHGAPRMFAARRFGDAVGEVPGANFEVTTDTEALRVLYSGAYRLAWRYFGHPTSPVHGLLQAGTYMFGVDGGPYGREVQPDPNAIVDLPGPPSVHLNY
jgi:hypothetical protein